PGGRQNPAAGATMKMNKLALLWIMSLTIPAVTASAGDETAPKPPVAKRVVREYTIYGDKITDPYYGMRDKKNPQVAPYLEAANAYADAIMKPCPPHQEALYKE